VLVQCLVKVVLQLTYCGAPGEDRAFGQFADKCRRPKEVRCRKGGQGAHEIEEEDRGPRYLSGVVTFQQGLQTQEVPQDLLHSPRIGWKEVGEFLNGNLIDSMRKEIEFRGSELLRDSGPLPSKNGLSESPGGAIPFPEVALVAKHLQVSLLRPSALGIGRDVIDV
jgi:hypothetical protein